MRDNTGASSAFPDDLQDVEKEEGGEVELEKVELEKVEVNDATSDDALVGSKAKVKS